MSERHLLSKYIAGLHQDDPVLHEHNLFCLCGVRTLRIGRIDGSSSHSSSGSAVAELSPGHLERCHRSIAIEGGVQGNRVQCKAQRWCECGEGEKE